MIDVEMKRSEDEQSYILTMHGHAEHVKTDPMDPVCASASILAYTVAQCVDDMHRAKGLRKKPTIKLDKGSAEIVFKPKKNYEDDALTLLWVAENGFTLLAHNFPDSIQVKTL